MEYQDLMQKLDELDSKETNPNATLTQTAAVDGDGIYVVKNGVLHKVTASEGKVSVWHKLGRKYKKVC